MELINEQSLHNRIKEFDGRLSDLEFFSSQVGHSFGAARAQKTIHKELVDTMEQLYIKYNQAILDLYVLKKKEGD